MSTRKSVVKASVSQKDRNVHEVPFVELFGQRLQGVVSSGSDVNRVYVAFVEAGTFNYSCSTNNNRPCGGGGFCKHLRHLVDEAYEQFGGERLWRYLQIPGDMPEKINGSYDLINHIRGSSVRAPAANVFSRFLGYLRYVELESSTTPLPEMTWFVSG